MPHPDVKTWKRGEADVRYFSVIFLSTKFLLLAYMDKKAKFLKNP